MYIYIFPFCWQGKIQNHDTGETNTRLSCKVNNAFYMRGTKTGPVSAVISQSIVSYLLYSSSFLLVPLFFFFFFFFSFFQSLPSNDNIFTCSALIYIHPEWATAMVYVKSRRRLQFLSDQPWRCSQAFIVLSCFFLRIRFSCFLLFSSFCLKYNSPPLLLFPFSFFFSFYFFFAGFLLHSAESRQGVGLQSHTPSVFTLRNKPTGSVHMRRSASKRRQMSHVFRRFLESLTCSYPRTVSHHTVSRYPLSVSLFISPVWQIFALSRLFLLRPKSSLSGCRQLDVVPCFLLVAPTKPQRGNVFSFSFVFFFGHDAKINHDLAINSKEQRNAVGTIRGKPNSSYTEYRRNIYIYIYIYIYTYIYIYIHTYMYITDDT